jgi:hypothetical protein
MLIYVKLQISASTPESTSSKASKKKSSRALIPAKARTLSAKEFLDLSDVPPEIEWKVRDIPVGLKAKRLLTESLEAAKHKAPAIRNVCVYATEKKSGRIFSVKVAGNTVFMPCSG